MKKVLEMTLEECKGMTIGEILNALVEEVKSNNDSTQIETVRIINQLIQQNENAFESKVSYTLRKLGVPNHINGNEYLMSAIVKVIKSPELLKNMTTVLYPTIAKEYNTTWKRVERDIRYAIEIAWNKGNEDSLSYYLGYSRKDEKQKPKNKEFIMIIASQLRIHLKREGVI